MSFPEQQSGSLPEDDLFDEEGLSEDDEFEEDQGEEADPNDEDPLRFLEQHTRCKLIESPPGEESRTTFDPHQRYDQSTGEKLPLGTPRSKVSISDRQRYQRRKVNVNTGEFLPYSERVGGDVHWYSMIYKFAIFDEKTLEKQPWGTALRKGLIRGDSLYKKWPTCKLTGKPLAWGTPLSQNVITRRAALKRWPCDAKTGRKYPYTTPYSKDIISTTKLQSERPHDVRDGKRLPVGTPIGGHVVTYRTIRSSWPYSVETGKRLAYTTPKDGKSVISLGALYGRWPMCRKTGKKLSWGTALEKNVVVTKNQLKGAWPTDIYTGKALNLTEPYSKTVLPWSVFYKRYYRETKEGLICSGINAIKKAENEARESGKKILWKVHAQRRRTLNVFRVETEAHRVGSPVPPDVAIDREKHCAVQTLYEQLKKNPDYLVYGSGRLQGRPAPVGSVKGKFINGVLIMKGSDELRMRRKQPKYRYFSRNGTLEGFNEEEKTVATSFLPQAKNIISSFMSKRTQVDRVSSEIGVNSRDNDLIVSPKRVKRK